MPLTSAPLTSSSSAAISSGSRAGGTPVTRATSARRSLRNSRQGTSIATASSPRVMTRPQVSRRRAVSRPAKTGWYAPRNPSRKGCASSRSCTVIGRRERHRPPCRDQPPPTDRLGRGGAAMVSCRSGTRRPPQESTVSVVTFQNVEKSYGGRRLFTTVTFALDAHDHAALVGRNGSGKTTILRLIAGAEHRTRAPSPERADGGSGSTSRPPSSPRTGRSPTTSREAFGEAGALEARLRATEEALAGLDEHSPELRDTMRAYQQLQRRFETLGGYAYKSRLERRRRRARPARRDARARPPLALGRRAHAGHARPRAARRCRPAPAGRADQPPRHRLGRVARAVPRRLPPRLRARHSRPPPARARRQARALARARARRGDRRRLRHLRARARVARSTCSDDATSRTSRRSSSCSASTTASTPRRTRPSRPRPS